MSVRDNVRMSKIMCTAIKVGAHTHATYANCRTLTSIPLLYISKVQFYCFQFTKNIKNHLPLQLLCSFCMQFTQVMLHY